MWVNTHSERVRQNMDSLCPHPVVGLPVEAAVGFYPRLAIHTTGMGEKAASGICINLVCVCLSGENEMGGGGGLAEVED